MSNRNARNPSNERRLNRARMDTSIRFGQLQMAIAVLGFAHVGHITGGYTVTELSGKMFVVRNRFTTPICVTCDTDNDDHTALVRLYRARLGQFGLGESFR